MDDFDHVGDYMMRTRDNDPMAESPMTKGHRVESRIEDRFVTHCGRQMARREGTLLVFWASISEDLRCLRC